MQKSNKHVSLNNVSQGRLATCRQTDKYRYYRDHKPQEQGRQTLCVTSMRRIIFISTLLISTINLLGQIENEVTASLKTLDFSKFLATIDSLKNTENSNFYKTHYFRDIVDNYQEGLWRIDHKKPYDTISNSFTISNYKIKILNYKGKIFYFEFSKKVGQKVKRKWEYYFQTITTYRDSLIYDSLKNRFFSVFGLQLNEKELFMENIFYGTFCGHRASSELPERSIIESYVLTKDKESILKLAKSPNTEKQIFAVDGLMQLKEKGVTLSDSELTIIKVILGKTGTIQTCSGCLFQTRDIKVATYKFQ